MCMKFVTFGDSWPFGAELQEGQHPFGYWIAKELHCKFENRAKQGTTIEHLILQIKNYVMNESYKNTIALFFLTNPVRGMYYKKGEWLAYRPTGQQKEEETKAYYKHLQSSELDNHRANVTMIALQHICEKYNIKDYYLEGWSDINFTYPSIDKTKIYKKTASQIINAKIKRGVLELQAWQDQDLIRPNKYHPNENGHKLIAKTMVEWIK